MSDDYYTATEIVIDAIKDYGEYLEDIFYSLPMEYSLEQMSYSKWAISELLSELECCLPGDELQTMENLRNKLCGFSTLNSKSSHIFSIASDIVNNAIDLFMSY